MMRSNQLAGILLILVGLFDVVVFPGIMVSLMQKQNAPESQINITKKVVIFVGFIVTVLGLALYAGVIG
jgi:predicted cation transporter